MLWGGNPALGGAGCRGRARQAPSSGGTAARNCGGRLCTRIPLVAEGSSDCARSVCEVKDAVGSAGRNQRKTAPGGIKLGNPREDALVDGAGGVDVSDAQLRRYRRNDHLTVPDAASGPPPARRSLSAGCGEMAGGAPPNPRPSPANIARQHRPPTSPANIALGRPIRLDGRGGGRKRNRTAVRGFAVGPAPPSRLIPNRLFVAISIGCGNNPCAPTAA